MGVSLNTVQRMLLQRDVCCIHTFTLKPTLTDENKVSTMELALSFININDTSKFEHMEDLIHVDEKWFYLTKDGQCFVIVSEEAEPYRHFTTQVVSDDDHVPMCCGKALIQHEQECMVSWKDWNLAYLEM